MKKEQRALLNEHIAWLEMQPYVDLAIQIAQAIKELMAEVDKAEEVE